jgi:hypothetical protein
VTFSQNRLGEHAGDLASSGPTAQVSVQETLIYHFGDCPEGGGGSSRSAVIDLGEFGQESVELLGRNLVTCQVKIKEQLVTVPAASCTAR